MWPPGPPAAAELPAGRCRPPARRAEGRAGTGGDPKRRPGPARGGDGRPEAAPARPAAGRTDRRGVGRRRRGDDHRLAGRGVSPHAGVPDVAGTRRNRWDGARRPAQVEARRTSGWRSCRTFRRTSRRRRPAERPPGPDPAPRGCGIGSGAARRCPARARRDHPRTPVGGRDPPHQPEALRGPRSTPWPRPSTGPRGPDPLSVGQLRHSPRGWCPTSSSRAACSRDGATCATPNGSSAYRRSSPSGMREPSARLGQPERGARSRLMTGG